MARYKRIDLSPRFLAVDLSRQILPGSFECALSHLIDHLSLTLSSRAVVAHQDDDCGDVIAGAVAGGRQSHFQYSHRYRTA